VRGLKELQRVRLEFLGDAVGKGGYHIRRDAAQGVGEAIRGVKAEELGAGEIKAKSLHEVNLRASPCIDGLVVVTGAK
jgi:hypothetical protein